VLEDFPDLSEFQVYACGAPAMVDAALRLNPEVKGVDFYGDRLLVVAPLAVVFMIREEDRIVEVLQTLASPAP